MYKDLSILIPARNEMFLAKTIETLLENIEADTEIIAVLDGCLADPPIKQHPRVTVVALNESIGQRAATNLACKLSKAKYVMKLDAHCSVGKGFDRILLEDMQEDWTVVPTMYNLHAFDWVCECGQRDYQGTTHPCGKCGKGMKREIIWKAKPSPETTSMRFDTDLRFNYWGDYKKKQKGDLVETMSILGACFMLSRKKYWELNICDENFGSWGQQGTEVSCKTWLSGGKVICNKKTWFAHMFRTQGGDFGFPYPLSGSAVEKARKLSKELFLQGKFKGKYDLQWLINRFSPPGWTETPTKGIVFYTDNALKLKIAHEVQKNLSRTGYPIVSSSLKPMTFGDNVVVSGKRSALTMFRQILAGLEKQTSEIVFLCEHDVLYHPSHFDFNPPKKDVYYYNINVWKTDGKRAYRVNDCRQLSGLCAYRETLINHFKKRIEIVEKNGFSMKMGFEPGTHNRKERIDNFKSETWESQYPNIDIRHGSNFTNTKWSPEEFRSKKNANGWRESDTIEGWGNIEKFNF